MSGTPERDALEHVYRGDLVGFLERRKAAAARAREDGRNDLAQQIAKWSKPKQTLWAVNQLVWQERDLLNRMQQSGEVLVEALAGRGELSVQEASRRRQERIEEGVEWCAGLLAGAGLGAGRAALDRVQRALEALTVLHLRRGASMDGPGGLGSLVVESLAPDFFDLIELGVEIDVEAARELRRASLPRDRDRQAAMERPDGSAQEAPPASDAPGVDQKDDGPSRRQQEAVRQRLESRLKRALEAQARSEAELEKAAGELQMAERKLGRAESAVARAVRKLENARVTATESEEERDRARRRKGKLELDLERTVAQVRRLTAELNG